MKNVRRTKVQLFFSVESKLSKYRQQVLEIVPQRNEGTGVETKVK